MLEHGQMANVVFTHHGVRGLECLVTTNGVRLRRHDVGHGWGSAPSADTDRRILMLFLRSRAATRAPSAVSFRLHRIPFGPSSLRALTFLNRSNSPAKAGTRVA